MDDDGYAPDPRRWRALTVCLSAGFMTLLDVSIVNVALPSIRDGLDASSGQLQWVLAGYSLAFGLVLVPAGRVGDARGRRTAFLTALALFVLTSAAAGLAQTAWWLVAARLAQGAAAGMLNPQTSGVIQDLFRGPERGRAFGRMGATIGLSTAVGPLAGGIILAVDSSEQGWRWVFLVNVPVGLVAMVLAWRLLPADRRTVHGARRESLDPVGAVLLGIALLLVLLPLVQEREWSGVLPWLLVPAGLLVAATFLRWERWYVGRGHAPLIDPALYRLPSFRLGSLLAAAYFAGFTSLFFVLALFLQIGRGYTPLMSGLAVTPFALGSGVAASVGGRLVSSAGRTVVLVGLALVIGGLAVTDLVVAVVGEQEYVGWAIAVPLLVAGAGSGLVIAPNRTLTLADVPVARGGVAAGVLQVGQRVGAAVGIASVGAVFFHVQALAGSWADAVRWSLWAAIGFLVVALALAVADRRRRAVEPV
ncbi:MAG TPA: MFS transporter [Nocardioidaceae bacterium]|nr:MFS transporter [Nocardioidaceae bacterium]